MNFETTILERRMPEIDLYTYLCLIRPRLFRGIFAIFTPPPPEKPLRSPTTRI